MPVQSKPSNAECKYLNRIYFIMSIVQFKMHNGSNNNNTIIINRKTKPFYYIFSGRK